MEWHEVVKQCIESNGKIKSIIADNIKMDIDNKSIFITIPFSEYRLILAEDNAPIGFTISDYELVIGKMRTPLLRIPLDNIKEIKFIEEKTIINE